MYNCSITLWATAFVYIHTYNCSITLLATAFVYIHTYNCNYMCLDLLT
jgi:hypothetical protein